MDQKVAVVPNGLVEDAVKVWPRASVPEPSPLLFYRFLKVFETFDGRKFFIKINTERPFDA
jgi:hypothetical protein